MNDTFKCGNWGDGGLILSIFSGHIDLHRLFHCAMFFKITSLAKIKNKVRITCLPNMKQICIVRNKSEW